MVYLKQQEVFMEIIDCKSLMIGDWVMLTDPINNGEKVQVKEIHADGYIAVDGGLTAHVEPIPLSLEILKKNGFKKSDVKDSTDWSYYKTDKTGKGMYCIFYSVDDDMFLEIASYKSYIGEYHRFGVRYVHELQHAMHLCGIDKEITI